jgi:hypothetical protein
VIVVIVCVWVRLGALVIVEMTVVLCVAVSPGSVMIVGVFVVELHGAGSQVLRSST